MDTRDLKVFVAVYETKSITRAAKDQFLSPQGCSKIIQKIEGELGTSLFARNHFGVAPTPQGMRSTAARRWSFACSTA